MMRSLSRSDADRAGSTPPTVLHAASLNLLGSALGLAVLVSLATPAQSPVSTRSGAAVTKPIRSVAANGPAILARLDPTYLNAAPLLSPRASLAWGTAPISADLRLSSRVANVAVAQPILPARQIAPALVAADPAAPELGREPVRVAPSVPLPVPRPTELGGEITSADTQLAGRKTSRRTRFAAAPEPQADNRSFFEKLFGVQPAPAPGVAYAALGGGALPAAPALKLAPSPAPQASGGTAVYDITARVVTLPNGERLEAHSGLGEKLDDPRFVHVRMRGATPPATYDLTEREQLFHGVRALRLTPVGGSGAVHGRAGLLAHTFMLGPNGDSNGCVSFRDYERFLQAYLRGEIRQLVVVAGGQDGGPFFNRHLGQRETAGRPGPG